MLQPYGLEIGIVHGNTNPTMENYWVYQLQN